MVLIKRKQKHRYENHWKRIEDPDVNPCIYAFLAFDKGTKNI
jgi:hypothetical protein